ncbi:hypothetical protein [Flectobacillus sp. BAB-3569]|uniref:hypothetical protein n=1 Tax=Flectobacillus sp. BAB-3569 TaxID=1509483 RepID=UPI000BA4DC51|nr:hypothetical protein [Flectobacillus sp. BAB-3569]PAC27762.1 hypothetical protein BWI92_21355 [Flectobacillus sp. BAB-3569]
MKNSNKKLRIRAAIDNSIKTYIDKSEKYKGFMPKYKVKAQDKEHFEDFAEKHITLKSRAKYELDLVEELKSRSFNSYWGTFQLDPNDLYAKMVIEKLKISYREYRNCIELNFDYFRTPAERAYTKIKERQAEVIYTHAVHCHPDVDPKCFRIWEEISWKTNANVAKEPQYLKRNGLVLFEKGLGYGAWDSNGVWGVSPHTIVKAWFLSGAKDCQKFRVILHHLHILGKKYGRYDGDDFIQNIRKNASAEETSYFLKGKRFVQQWTNYGRNFKYKDFVRVGKVKSLPIRLALITDTGTYEAKFNGWRYQSLNYEYASKVQKMSKADQAKILPSKAAWYYLYGRCPFDNSEATNKDIPKPSFLSRWKKGAATFAKLCQHFGKDKSMLLPNFNLATLFGSEAEILKFVNNNTHRKYVSLEQLKGSNVIHDFGQFTLPTSEFSISWKDFVMKYPEALKFSTNWVNVENTLGRLPKSLVELRNTVAQFHYENVTNPLCAVACFELKLSQYQFERYQALYNNLKVAESCPHVHVTQNGFTFRKLAYDDPKGALLGLITNCCQHLEGAASACAKHGVQEESSAFYVVEKDGKIIAQSWAWRSQKGDLVFDSIEAVSNVYQDSIASMYQLASEKIIGKLGINRVLVGSTSYGITYNIKNILQKGSEIFSEQMVKDCSYMDGKNQWLLAETGDEPIKLKKRDIKPSIKPKHQSIVSNTLLEGSDVYCEYCDAEVHPDCEICPNCHENIAEWV